MSGNTLFAHLDFPKYEFHEYPKWVKTPAGAEVIVHTAAEQAEVTGVAAAEVRSEVADDADTAVEAAVETAETPDADAADSAPDGATDEPEAKTARRKRARD